MLKVVTFKKGDQLKHRVTGSMLFVDHIMITKQNLLVITEYGDRIPPTELINVSWHERNAPIPIEPEPTPEEVDLDSLFMDGSAPEGLTGF